MVAGPELVLAVFAYVSTIVATLRAGSRALYLIEHQQIGVMDGPLILGLERNDTGQWVSALWEVAFMFEQSVRLALDPNFMTYEGVKETIVDPRMLALLDSNNGESIPYSLSPYPVSDTNTNESDSVFGDVAGESVGAEAIDAESHHLTKQSGWKIRKRGKKMMPLLRWLYLPNYLPELPISRRLRQVSWTYYSATRRTLFCWLRKGWHRTGDSDATVDNSWEDGKEGEREDWDYATCVSSEISYNTTDMTHRFARLSAFAPDAFADLRSRFGIDESSFRQSIFGAGPFVSFQSNSKGAARVGGIFFFTRDGAYMIKSIKKEEALTLLSMLPKYHKFMKRNARRSLLTRFCGMYGVQISDDSQFPERSLLMGIADKFRPSNNEEHIFVVMNAVFPAEAAEFISERFDLKGSTVGRECSTEEREISGANAVLKDLDLAREVELVRSLGTGSSELQEYGLHIGATAKATLLSQLRRDVRLLVDCNVMDYSLLVGVVNMDSHHVDMASLRMLELSERQESRLREQRTSGGKQRRLDRIILSSIVTPIRTLLSPPLFFCRRAVSILETTVSSILTRPLPYYGAGICGVNGGAHSVIHGKRTGNRAIYYMGLIDFLQPWTTRKVLERQWKGFLGYDKHAISCVDPMEYASRFLEYIDAHVS